MKKKLTLKKEAITILENLNLERIVGGGEDYPSWMAPGYCYLTIGQSCYEDICQTQVGGGGARAAGSCNNCEQNTVGGKNTCFPYDCAPTDGGNSCNFPDGCHLPSVGCAQ